MIAAHAAHPTPQHVHQYIRAYREVRLRFGWRTPGRNIIRWGTVHHRRATDGQVVASIRVLRRMFDPVPQPAYASRATILPYHGPTVPVAQPGQAQTATSVLAACIISRESGGNPHATNGQYGGIGQWNAASWARFGGTRYSATPQGASYAQQVAVLNSEGPTNQYSQQGQYDGC